MRSMYRPRSNPLTGFDRLQEGAEPLTPGRVFASFRPLLLPKAGEVYDKELAAVPFPLRIVVVEAPNFRDSRGNVRTRERDRFVLAVMEEAERFVVGSGENIALLILEEDVSRGSAARVQRGSPFRTSPFTAFTILHRMWDSMAAGNGPSVSDVVPEEMRSYVPGAVFRADADLSNTTQRLVEHIYKGTKGATRDDRPLIAAQLFSAGVNTAAGRMGVLGDADQALADLFALRAKTGRWGYDPYALPTLNPKYGSISKWPEDILAARIAYNQVAQALVDDMIEGLRGGGFVFLIQGA